jgi:hypothetical protein
MQTVQSPTVDPSAQTLRPSPMEGDLNPRQDLMEYAKQYAREKPDVVALWCFGVGFILGWKLKPW